MTGTLPRSTRLTPADLTRICCGCKRENTPDGEWREHIPVAGERLTHGICPDCLYELYPDVAPLIRPRG